MSRTNRTRTTRSADPTGTAREHGFETSAHKSQVVDRDGTRGVCKMLHEIVRTVSHASRARTEFYEPDQAVSSERARCDFSRTASAGVREFPR